jgi:hypothetical protein
MRITLSAEESLIQRARQRATAENTTLNDLFRAWIEHYVAQDAAADEFAALMARLEHVEAGGKLSRDELEAR